jgi:hypothetical protein
MKTVHPIVMGMGLLLCIAVPSPGTTLNWKSFGSGTGGAELGITTSAAGQTQLDPWLIESGYSGLFGFGNRSPYFGFAQEFTVASNRTLKSVDLRLCKTGDISVSGRFKLRILEYTGSPNDTYVRAKATLFLQANQYAYSYLSTPVSSFDFSSFNILLSKDKTYAVALLPTVTMEGTLGIHAIGNSSGPSYYTAIPEPATVSLFLLSLGMPIWKRSENKAT